MHTFLIIKREYLERVRRKSFIISTILMPVLMIAMMILPGIIAATSGPENKSIAVIDRSGAVAPVLTAAPSSQTGMTFTAVADNIDDAKANTDYDAVMVIESDVVQNNDHITLYSEDALSMQTEQMITQLVGQAIEARRLQAYNIENLPQILASVQPDVHITTVNNEGQTSSSIANYMTGLVMMMILYMFILLYGQMVMTSIIEEKNNRVLEVVVSSVRPGQLMLGKILGIGAVAVTQMLIWTVLIFAFMQWGMPLIADSIGGGVNLADLLGGLADTGHVMYLFGCMILLMIGGYMFYSSIYAAIGSAVDNIQDASQLQSFAIVPIILAIVLAFQAINDPFSSTAVVLSMVPFTSPMVMMARLPYGVPGWQLAASLAILALSVWIMVWLSAKIYRVGIFMYGKKPTVKDLVRWTRYK